MMSTRLSNFKTKLENYIISNLNSLRFELTEPIMLRWARVQYEKDYSLDRGDPLITVYIPTYNLGNPL